MDSGEPGRKKANPKKYGIAEEETLKQG